MAVIGTAGHVDHGKSTLIEALTGRNPDRLAEERARGLTIDLGFSWMVLPGETEVSFVDVPGHERFVKNMLAGIEVIDIALFVVAADEGWMPQSEEHAAVLDLLDVSAGVIALTKIDKVDDELIELARSEILDQTSGTSLQGFPIIPVSAMTGAGLDRLTTALASVTTNHRQSVLGRTKLWVDRSFSIRGAGTVVTGSLQGGKLAVGDSVSIWPGDREARIRGLESHEERIEAAHPGSRLAVNLQRVATEDLSRGSLLYLPGEVSPSARFAAVLRSARYAGELTTKGDYQIHLGSGVWNTKLRSLRDGVAFFDVSHPIPLEIGDRFVIRDTGRSRVVAGGRVLLPDPPAPTRTMRSADRLLEILDASPDERADVVLDLWGRLELPHLRNHTGGGQPHSGRVDSDTVLAPRELIRIEVALVEQVRRFHEEAPLRPGLPTAQAAERAGISAEALKAIVSGSDDLMMSQHVVHMKGFSPELDDVVLDTWKEARRTLVESGLSSLPRSRELGLSDEVIHALIRQDELVRVSDEFVCLPEQVDEVVATIDSFVDFFTVGDFKERTGLSRKYAIPLLDWADSVGHTIRVGDLRRRVART